MFDIAVYHCAYTVSRVSSRFDWQSVSPGGTTPSHVVPSALCSRHVHGAYSYTGPGCGRGSAAVPPTRSLNTFKPSPVHVNPYQYAGTTLSTCAVSTYTYTYLYILSLCTCARYSFEFYIGTLEEFFLYIPLYLPVKITLIGMIL